MQHRKRITEVEKLQKKPKNTKIIESRLLYKEKLNITPHLRINHRITECFVLEGTFRGHLAQIPGSEQGHLHLD